MNDSPRAYVVSRDVLRAALVLDGVYWTGNRSHSARTAMLKLLRGSCEFSCRWEPRRAVPRVVSFYYRFI